MLWWRRAGSRLALIFARRTALSHLSGGRADLGGNAALSPGDLPRRPGYIHEGVSPPRSGTDIDTVSRFTRRQFDHIRNLFKFRQRSLRGIEVRWTEESPVHTPRIIQA